MNQPTTILIVDDDPLIMMVILQIVTRAVPPTTKILTATDGEEGLRTALAAQPDIIITDLMMPKMDGHEMVQALRRAGLECSVIGISCSSLCDTRTKAFSQLCDNFLNKPFMPQELITRLKGLALTPHQSGQPAQFF
jgi:CheY-like chemotaxis protein